MMTNKVSFPVQYTRARLSLEPLTFRSVDTSYFLLSSSCSPLIFWKLHSPFVLWGRQPITLEDKNEWHLHPINCHLRIINFQQLPPGLDATIYLSKVGYTEILFPIFQIPSCTFTASLRALWCGDLQKLWCRVCLRYGMHRKHKKTTERKPAVHYGRRCVFVAWASQLPRQDR